MTDPVVLVEDTAKLTRAEWLQVRTGYLGGSDAAAVAGLDRWRSPVQVWLEKTGQAPPERITPDVQERLDWGHLLEPVIAGEWARREGVELVDDRRMLRHPTVEFMSANLDRRTTDGTIVECKNAGADASRYIWSDPDEPPDYVFVQVLHYMAVTGLDRAVILVLLAGSKLRPYEIERDDAAIDHLVTLEEAFWGHVTDRTMPTADGSDRTTDAIKGLWEARRDLTRDLPPSALELIDARHRYRAAEQEAADLATAAENQLRQLLGDAEIGQVDGHTVVTWKASRSFDEAAYRQAHPERAARHLVLDRKAVKADDPKLYDTFMVRDPRSRRLNFPKRKATDG